jgi:biopolymer transport protein TolQ
MTSSLTLPIVSGALWQIISNLSTFGAIILIILVIMSVISWTVIIRKLRMFRAANADTVSFTEYFRRARRLDEVSTQARSYRSSPLASLYTAGIQEVSALKAHKNQAPGLQGAVVPLDNGDFELVEMAMERGLNDEVAKLEKQVVFLATTGSSAPFMGLLGTVVGIMDSFWAIGERGSASLAVVAPGIAEALLATIVGLGAAIPAVIAYNWANNTTKVIQNQGYNFVLEFISRVRKEAMQ